MLPDVEGNRAIDLAKKKKHSKCVNYLEQVMKKGPRVNGSVMVRSHVCGKRMDSCDKKCACVSELMWT